MPLASVQIEVERDAPIPTWFGVGGRAERLARPCSVEELRRCVEMDPRLRVLGDGANLLVDDDGVAELVVALRGAPFADVRWDSGHGAPPVIVHAGSGANLPRLIVEAVRRGLGGIEGLGGIPATLGGAVMMNAGGKFGQIADVVERVHAVDRDGGVHAIGRDEIEFDYRRSGLDDLIVTGVDLRLTPADPAALRDRLREVMAYKKDSQPLKERSAGCCFKNPTLTRDVDGIGSRGERVGAGLLIDRAGCKGLTIGGAGVSPGHANFIVAGPGGAGRAREVIAVMDEVERRVLERFGVRLEREVVIWRRNP